MKFETIFETIFGENEGLNPSLTSIKEAEDFLNTIEIGSEAALLSHEVSVARFLATGEPISRTEIGNDAYYGRAYTRPTDDDDDDSLVRESMHRRRAS